MRAILCILTVAVAAPAFADESFALGTLAQQARLDSATAEKVQTIVDRYRGKIDPLRQQDRELVRALRMQLSNKPDDKTVTQLSNQLIKNRAKLRDLRADRLTSIKKALPPATFARLLLAMPRIDRALQRHAIERVRNSDS